MPLRTPSLLLSLLAMLCLTIGCGGTGGAGDQTAGSGDVTDLAQGYVYYVVDHAAGMGAGLYRTRIGETVPELISNDPAPNQSVSTYFAVSPNGRHVAFAEDREMDDRYDVYIADADGANLRRVSGATQPTSSVGEFAWAPDSSRLAYEADQLVDGRDELFTASPTSGGDAIRVSAPFAAGQKLVGDILWSPDGTRIAYGATTGNNGGREVWTTSPTSSASAVKISGPMVAGGGSREYAWSPDSSRVLYKADQNIKDQYEQFTVRPTGADLVRVSIPLQAGGQTSSADWSPDGSRILYRVRIAAGAVGELYTTLPHTDAGNIRVSGDLTMAALGVTRHAWSPDGSRIAYTADQDVAGKLELFVTIPDGPLSGRVSHLMADDRDVKHFAWSPDGANIAYVSNSLTTLAAHLYVTAANASTSPLLVSTPHPEFWMPLNVRWSPDGEHIAYNERHSVLDTDRLYTTRAAGGGATDVSGPWTYDGRVSGFAWKPDSSRILFVSNETDANHHELHIAEPGVSASSYNPFPFQDFGTTVDYEFVVR